MQSVMNTEPKSDDETNAIDQDEVDDAVRDALKDTVKLSADDIEAAMKEREAADAAKRDGEEQK